MHVRVVMVGDHRSHGVIPEVLSEDGVLLERQDLVGQRGLLPVSNLRF